MAKVWLGYTFSLQTSTARIFLKDVTCFMPHGSARAQLRHNNQDEVGEVGGEKA